MSEPNPVLGWDEDWAFPGWQNMSLPCVILRMHLSETEGNPKI